MMNFKKLLAYQDKIISLDDNDAMSYYDKGITLMEMKLYELAITVYKMALELENNSLLNLLS